MELTSAVCVTLLLLVPLLAGIALLALPVTSRGDRAIGLGAAVVTAALAVPVVVGSYSIDRPWIRSLGVRWHFASDGLSAALVLLTAAVTLAVIVHALAGDSPPGGSRATYLGAILLVEAGALATFLARDAVLFFIAFEVVLVPMWVLIRRFGDDHVADEDRADAAGRFVLFTVFGSTLMLIGILMLTWYQGTSDLDTLAALHGDGLAQPLQVTVAAVLLTGLAVKVPVWPLHTWLPSAHTVAPTAGSVLLAAVLLKMGTYGIVRLVVPAVPDGLAALSPVLAILGVVGIIWAGLACLVERDLKRLVAYSSVAHMGFVALGLASGTQTGLQAALFGNIAHGVVSALLFFVVGGLKDRWGGADLTAARDALRDVSPRMGFALVVGLASALGLPGLIGFWGEFLAVYAAWNPAAGLPTGLLRACAVAGVVGMTLAAGYALRVLRLVWSGHANWTGPAVGESVAGGRRGDARGAEMAVLLALVVLVIGLGVVPNPLLGLTEPAADMLVTRSTPATTPPPGAGGTIVEAGR